jgi:hypothetical protein
VFSRVTAWPVDRCSVISRKCAGARKCSGAASLPSTLSGDGDWVCHWLPARARACASVFLSVPIGPNTGMVPRRQLGPLHPVALSSFQPGDGGGELVTPAAMARMVATAASTDGLFIGRTARLTDQQGSGH